MKRLRGLPKVELEKQLVISCALCGNELTVISDLDAQDGDRYRVSVLPCEECLIVSTTITVMQKGDNDNR